jgi:uncharacterized damage-inducible protein DinB
MRVTDIRLLYDYDRWATERILVVAQRIPEFEWSDPNRIDRRGLGGILTHALGAHERWRSGWQGLPRPARREDGPLPMVEDLHAAWLVEWELLDGYLGGLADADLDQAFEDMTTWHTLVHIVNHGTQHRSEAAVLLTAVGRSPGDLDLIDFTAARVGS